MKRKFYLLMTMLLFFAGGAKADQLTVNDGTTTNNYVPVYGLYADSYLKCQMIYPGNMLTEMVGGTINSLTFYLSQSAAVQWTSNGFQVYMAEYEGTTISSYIDAADATTVYTGTLDATGSTMTVTFATPYVYGGGNLLIGVNNNVKGNYKSAYFYGVSANGACVQGYSGSSLAGVTCNQRSFLPKTTFEYIKSTGLAVNPVDFGYRPNNAWMEPVTMTVDGGVYNVTAMDLDNDYFTLNVQAPFTTPKVFSATTGTAEVGPVEGTLTMMYNGSKSVKQFNLTANAYNPANGDVYEKATVITTPANYSNTPVFANLYRNYNLPGDAEGTEAVDAAYKMTFSQDVMYLASVGAAADGNVALYNEDFGGQGGPMANNAYTYNGPKVNPVEYAGIMAKRDELRGVATVLDEGFEGGSVPTGWIKNGSWAAKTSAGSYTAKSGSYSAFMTGTTSWVYESIVSKAIDLTNATSASLSFDYVTGGGSFGYNYTFVYVRESQTTSSVGTSIIPATDLQYDQVWTNHVCDLSAYCGNTIYIQFASMDMGAVCGIDNVKVTAETFSPATDGMFVPAGTYYAIGAASEPFTFQMGTAAAPAPVQAEVLYPYNGQVNVESTVLAQWVLGDYTTEMQVRFGTSYPPAVMIDWTDYLQEGAPLMNLLPNTTYFLQVNERNSSGTTEGEIIGFTTVLESPVAEVAEANLYPGDAAQLSWAIDRSFRGYNVYVDGERWNETVIEDDEYAVEGLPYGEHVLNVTAVYDEGESAFSNSVTVNMTGYGQVEGVVYEQDGETPVAEATVQFVGIDAFGADATFEFMTAADGTFAGDVLEGVFTPISSKDGYQNAQLDNVTIVYDELTDGLVFNMSEFYAPVGDVVAEELENNTVNVYWTWTPASMIEDFEHDGAMPEGWTQAADYGFEITTNSPYEGTYCMKSTNYNVASSTAAIEITVEVPYEAKMSFMIKPSSESNFDKGYFYLDGVEKCNVSGAGSWAKKEYSVSAGTHTYKWAYTKDSSVNSNDDCLYVDYVTLFEKDEPVPPVPGGVTYDFEDGTFQGWTSIDADGDGYGWRVGTEYMTAPVGHESNDCVFSQSYDNSYGVLYPDNYLVSPSKLACQAGAMISFWACGQDASYAAEHFGVAVSTTGNTSGSDFTTISEWTLTAKGGAGLRSADGKEAIRGTRTQGTWYQFTADLSSYAGQEIWVAIRHFNSSDMFYIDVDDITLADGSAKAVAGDRTFTGAYNVYRRNNITLDETPEAVLLTTTADTTYIDQTWAAATPGVYQWGVAATYEGNRTRESVSYDFEDGTFQGWTSIDADGDGFDWMVGSELMTTPVGHNSEDCVFSQSYSNSYGVLYPDNYLVSPSKFPVAAGSNITFYACAQDANYSAEHYGVAVSTTGNTSASNFTTIAEWTMTSKGGANGTRGTNAQGTWYQKTVDLSAYAGQEIWIAIRHFNCSDWFYLDVDDITINYSSAPTPPVPAGEGESEIVWSNAIEKDMYATVTVNASCNNGGNAAGTTVKFTNNIENVMFEGTIDATGTLVFEDFRCGYYTLEVEKAGYTTAANGDYEILGDEEINILLEEIIMAAEDLYVSPTGWVKWTAILDEPTPGPGPTPGEGQWYGYDNDNANEDAIGTGGGQFSWGVMFPAGTYTGNVVTKVAAYDYMAMTGTATVYMGATAPTTAVGQTNVTMTGSSQYIEYELETPAVIDPSQNVWIIFYNASGATYPAAVCANTGDANGRWVSLDGVTWEDLASYGLSYTFMVRAYIASGAKSEVTEIEVDNVCTGGTLAKAGTPNNRQALYSIVMLDGVQVGQAPSNYFQLNEETLVEGQEYTVSVASVYATGMSDWMTTTFVYSACGNFEPGVTNLAATADNSDVTITWTLPGGGGGGGGTGDVFFEDFENGLPAGWTTIDADGDGYTWRRGTDYMTAPVGHNSNDCMFSNSYDNSYGVLYPDNYLVSPQVNIGSGSEFSFYACAQDASYAAEHFGVAVSTTGTSASDFTTIAEWTMTAKDGAKGTRGTNAQGTWYQKTVDLSSYAGQQVYIAIRHFNCSDMFYLDIDDAQLAVANKTRDGQYIQYCTEIYDGGVGTGGGEVWWGIKYPAAQLASYVGKSLTKIGIYTGLDGDYGWTYSGNYTAEIYLGSTPSASTLVSTDTESLTGDQTWHDVVLTTPVEIDGTQDLWLCFHTPDIAYPMSGCSYTGESNSDLLSLDGTTWEHAGDYGLSYTWMIRGYVEDLVTPFEGAILGAMIFRDGELITREPVSGTSMVDSNVEDGEHEYMARLAYGDATLGVLDPTWYAMSCPVYTTVTVEAECTPVSNLQGDYEVSSTGEITVELTWNCTDESALNFKVYRNGLYIGTTTDMVYTDDRTNNPGSYTYGVVAVYANCESDMVTVDVVITSIEDNAIIESIYPNPTNGNLYINATSMKQVTIANTLGQVILVKEVSGNSTTIDMSAFGAGVYMVTVATENGTSVKRISVIK